MAIRLSLSLSLTISILFVTPRVCARVYTLASSLDFILSEYHYCGFESLEILSALKSDCARRMWKLYATAGSGSGDGGTRDSGIKNKKKRTEK